VFLTKIPLVSPVEITSISTDSGTVGDQITNDQTLVISGTADGNGTVTLFRRNVGQIGTNIPVNDEAWSFDYTGTSLPDATHAFAAAMGDQSAEFLVVIDLTPPAVTVSVPQPTYSLAPEIRVTATDFNVLPNGTQVRIDVDLDNDGDYLDANESNYTTASLTD